MSRVGERFIVYSLLFLSLLFFLWYVVASPGVYQGGDTFQHYLIARGAPWHPHLFLDHWGKPVFTLIYALPAQWGYTAAEIVTVVLGLFTAALTYGCALKLNLRYAWMAVILVLFAPIFFVHMNSVMTEVLFACVLIGGIYLALIRKMIASAVLLSFLPFVRTEGFIIVPLLSVFYAMEKKWTSFFLLGTGFVMYSLIGWLFFYHDPLWVFTQNPYKVKSFYGNGEWMHFIKSNKVIWGIPLSIALGASMVLSLAKLFLPSDNPDRRKWQLLIFAPFFAFLLFHSVAWATGSLASNGEIRVMVCTIPLAALMTIRIFTFLKLQIRCDFISGSIAVLFAAVVISTPFQLHKVPLNYGIAQSEIHQACKYVLTNFPKRRVHFVDPQVAVELDRDAFDPDVLVQWFANPAHPEMQMNDGDLIVWDAHFASHEGGVDYATLSQNPNFRLNMLFQPEIDHIIFGKERYFVAVFEYIRQP